MSNLDWPEVEVSNDFFFMFLHFSQFSHFSIVTVARMQPVELRDRCQCNSAWAIYDHEILSLNTPCKPLALKVVAIVYDLHILYTYLSMK